MKITLLAWGRWGQNTNTHGFILMELSLCYMETCTKRRLLSITALLAVVALSGCVVTIDTTITSDGEIKEQIVEIDFEDQQNFSAAQAGANSEGYDSIGAFLSSDLENGSWDTVTTETDESEYTTEVIARGGTEDDVEGINITVDDEAGEVTYIDRDGNSRDGSGSVGEYTGEYIVRMPGEIISTNGDIVNNGATVRWEYSSEGTGVDELRVTSERTGANHSNGSDGSGPGFGLITVVLGIGLILATFVTAKLRQRQKE